MFEHPFKLIHAGKAAAIFLLLMSFSLSVTFYVYSNSSNEVLLQALYARFIIGSFLGMPIIGYLVYLYEILRESNNALMDRIYQDPQTGVHSRRGFFRNVKLVSTSHGPLLSPGAVLIVDADSFKTINDSYGHHIGDRTLEVIGAALNETFPKNAVIGRVGGEEFAIHIPRCDVEHAGKYYKKLQNRLKNSPIEIDSGEMIFVTLSLGGCVFSYPSELNYVYVCADDNLYAAKKSGRNRCVIQEVSEKCEARKLENAA